MPDIRDRYTLDASQYLNSMQRVIQATKAQADMAKEASYQATLNARRAADAAREAARVQKAAVREAAEAEKIARKENTDAARQAAEAARQRAEQAKQEYEQQANAAKRAREAELRAKEAAHEATRAEREATAAAKEQAQAQRDSAKASEALASKVKGLVASYISLQSVAKLVQLSDEYSNINAKLSMMEDRLESTKAMQDDIMASAKRSRALYTDTANLITKLGTMAGDAFGNFDELVAFSEQINKNLVLSGANASQASSVTMQLAQALASGALRGDELVSVLEGAPAITMRIAEYLDVDIGKIRELASEGAITAEIVKNAMFATAEETNAAFESMPMTWAQVWTEIANKMLEYSAPILEVVSYLAQHFDAFIPIISGVAAALAAYAVAQGVAAAATVVSTIATYGLWTAMMSNPIGWIVVAIGMIVGLIVRWIQSVGSLKIAWLKFTDTVVSAAEYMRDAVATVWDGILAIIAGAIAGVAMLIRGAINAAVLQINDIITKVNLVISAINAIPGMGEISLIPTLSYSNFGSGVTSWAGGVLTSTNAAIDSRNAARKISSVQRQTQIYKAEQELAASSAGGYDDLYGYLSQGLPSGASLLGSGGGGKGGSGGSGKGSSGSSGTLGKIASDTADIKKSVEMTHEDLSLLVDVATRKYVANVNLETRAPVINVTAQGTGDSETDAMRIADQLKRVLLEQMSSGGSLSYALP